MTPRVLDAVEIRSAVGIDDAALAAVENAFTWLAEGKTSMPPIMHVECGKAGDVDIKSAYVDGLDAFAVKIASGFFGNAAIGLPNSSGLVVLMSAQTGFCQCVFLDNGYLTDLRTGLAGAVAAKHLAPQKINTVGIVGSGIQARYQLECLKLVRDFKSVLVVGRDEGRVAAYCREMSEKLGVVVEPASSLEELVTESQTIVTTTQSTEPLILAEWLHPGLHITAMGSDLPGKRELAIAVLENADHVVCDSQAQCRIGGELQGVSETIAVTELGMITSGAAPGRQNDEEITIADLTGTGVQDTAIALETSRRLAT